MLGVILMLCFLFQKILISSAVGKGFVIGLIGNQLISLEFAEALYMKKGKNDNRWRLIKMLKPVPTIYIKHDSSLSDSSQGPSTSTSSIVDTMISQSIMPTISIPRKSPKKRLFREDEFSKFLDKDLIKDFSCVNESMCPAGYSCTKYDDHVVYYKMEISEKSIPCVTGTIRVDNLLHVQLF